MTDSADQKSGRFELLRRSAIGSTTAPVRSSRWTRLAVRTFDVVLQPDDRPSAPQTIVLKQVFQLSPRETQQLRDAERPTTMRVGWGTRDAMTKLEVLRAANLPVDLVERAASVDLESPVTQTSWSAPNDEIRSWAPPEDVLREAHLRLSAQIQPGDRLLRYQHADESWTFELANPQHIQADAAEVERWVAEELVRRPGYDWLSEHTQPPVLETFEYPDWSPQAGSAVDLWVVLDFSPGYRIAMDNVRMCYLVSEQVVGCYGDLLQTVDAM